MDGMFGATSDPYGAMQKGWESDAAKAAQYGPSYTMGMLARGAGAGLMGAMGMQQPEVAKQKKLQALFDESRDPGGDMEKTLDNLAKNFAREGLMEESIKANEMLEKYRTAQQDRELKKLDIESKVADREARAATARMIAENKLLQKPWGLDAVKFYQQKANAYDSASWTEWWKTMKETNGDWEKASAVLEQFEKKTNQVTWGKPFRDPETGDWVQDGSNGQRRKIDNAPKTVVAIPADATKFANLQLQVQERIDKAAAPFTGTIQAIEGLKPLMTEAHKGNSQAVAALNQQLTKMFKADSNIAAREIEAMRNTGPIGIRIANTVERWLNGGMTSYTQQEQQDLIDAMEFAAYNGRSMALGQLYDQYGSMVDDKGNPLFSGKQMGSMFNTNRYGIPGQPWKPKKSPSSAEASKPPTDMKATKDANGNWVVKAK